jgi:hypothetical protein
MSVPVKVEKKVIKKRKSEDELDDRKKKKKSDEDAEEEEEPESWIADVMEKKAWLMRVPNHLGARVSVFDMLRPNGNKLLLEISTFSIFELFFAVAQGADRVERIP